MKIAFIGAGSFGFTYRLLADILSYESLRDSELAFQDIDQERLRRLKTVVNAFLDREGYKHRPAFTVNRRQALKNANFAINLVKIGGLRASEYDMDIPKKYGLQQTIGDTCGIGGVFRAVRTIPFCLQLAQDMEQVAASGAVILNYTNPQSMLVMAVSQVSGIPFVGLCHSVQGTTRAVANFLGVPYDEVDYEAAGINHMAWLTKLERGGKNLYPKLIRKVKTWGIFGVNPKDEDDIRPFLGATRLDMLLRTGYVVTESSTHFPEYVPYYLRTKKLIRQYRIPIDQYQRNIANKERRVMALYRDAKRGNLPALQRSVEYGAQIMDAMSSGIVCRIYANVPNEGLIENLPRFSAAEVASLVDRNGVHPCHYGSLPTHLAALCRTNINVHQLVVEGMLRKNRDAIYWALMMDPLTRSMLDLDQIREVVDALIEKHKPYLRGYLK